MQAENDRPIGLDASRKSNSQPCDPNRLYFIHVNTDFSILVHYDITASNTLFPKQQLWMDSFSSSLCSVETLAAFSSPATSLILRVTDHDLKSILNGQIEMTSHETNANDLVVCLIAKTEWKSCFNCTLSCRSQRWMQCFGLVSTGYPQTIVPGQSFLGSSAD
jgi:hypothetical protein